MKMLFSLVIFPVCLLVKFHHAYKHNSKGNNYLQFLRAHRFMEIESKKPFLFSNFSEDLDELDAYEDQEQLKETNANKNNDKIEFKNVEVLMRKKEEEYNMNKNNNIGSGKACTISEKGILDASIDNENIFNIKSYVVTIASSSIVITQKEIHDDIIKTIPFESIKLPLETIEETRECWKIKTDSQNILLCGKNKHERDEWVHNILKALFCYNTNNLKIQKNLFETNDKIEFPKESTVEERIQNKRKKWNLENNKHYMNSKQMNKNNNADYKSEDITDLDLDLDLNQ